MQAVSFQANKKATAFADTFFTSQFFEFNNESSQMEDFDISKEYLKSQLGDDKSMIMRQYSEQCFLKLIQVHYRFLFCQSFKQWRKINQIQKRREKANPKNITKTLLKVFYLISKKNMAKTLKAFNKIANFTKQFQMKSYQTPMVKGIKKLEEWILSLNIKYYYNHPINSQSMVQEAFITMKMFSMANKNKHSLQNMVFLVKKMSDHFLVSIFNQKFISYQTTNEKIDIFIGTLSLILNPIKRAFIQKIKQSHLDSVDNYEKYLLEIQNEFQEQCCQSKNVDFGSPIKSIKLQQISQSSVIQQQYYQEKVPLHNLNELKAASTISQNITEDIEKVKPIQSSDKNKDLLFNDQNKQKCTPEQKNNIQCQNTKKNTLKFSKQLKRKSSNSVEPKNKLKFKSIPNGNTPKKVQQSYCEKYLQLTQKNHQSKNIDKAFQNKQLKQITQICYHASQINFKQLCFKNVDQSLVTFQKSLNFAQKSLRKISFNDKFNKLCPLKPQQLINSASDYSNFHAFPNINLQQIRSQASNVFSQNQNQKKLKIFKTIKSGKLLSKLQQFSANSLHSREPVNSPSKLAINFTYNQSNVNSKSEQNSVQINNQRLKALSGVVFERRIEPKSLLLQNSKSQKIINFRSLDRVKQISNSSSNDFKNQYRLPISYKPNEIFPKFGIKKRNSQLAKQYQTYPYNQISQRQDNLRKLKQTDEPRSNSLAFKTKRPMKTIKSSKSPSGIRNTQLKKEKKNCQKQVNLKSKKNKELKSQFIDRRDKISSNEYYNTENMTILSNRSGKGGCNGNLVLNSPYKTTGIKITNKK